MLEFYEIALGSLPEIAFACPVESEHYKNRFPHTENLLEIALVETGIICFEDRRGNREYAEPGTLSIVTKDTTCTSSALHPGIQRHTTAGITAAYSCTRRTAESPADTAALRAAVRDKKLILLPIRFPLGKHFQTVLDTLKRIAACTTAAEPTGRLRAISEWYTLAAELTEICLTELELSGRRFPPSAIRYVRRAEQYLQAHVRTPFSLSEAAQELNISQGYLQTVFQRVNRMSMVQYLNRYRVELAKQYVRSRRLTLAEISELVGVSDPAYMSCLFRRVTGSSYQSYLRLEKGMTSPDAQRQSTES